MKTCLNFIKFSEYENGYTDLEVSYKGDYQTSITHITKILNSIKNSLDELNKPQTTEQASSKIPPICDINGNMLDNNEVEKILMTFQQVKKFLFSLNGLKATDIPDITELSEDKAKFMVLGFSNTFRHIDIALFSMAEISNNKNAGKADIIVLSLKISEALYNIEHDLSFLGGLTAFDKENNKPFEVDTTEISKAVTEAISILDRTSDNQYVSNDNKM